MNSTQKSQTNPLEELVALDSALKATRIVLNEYEDDVTFNFNYLDVLNVSEIHLTKVLTWFLNPNESHRQKDLFLNAFVASYFHDENVSDWGTLIHVSSEKHIGVGQLDIHIEYEHFSIIIENKIWGKDDPHQLDKYLEWCEKQKKDHAVIFLTMDGQQPTNSSLWDRNNSKRNICISYNHDIHQWLRKNKDKCTASKVKYFISEILQWIEFKIEVQGGREFMSEEKVIEDLITSDFNKFRMLWDVTNVFDFNKYLTQQAVNDTIELLKKVTGEKLENYKISEDTETLFSKNTHGWICWEKKDTDTERSSLTYCIDSQNWVDGFCIGIAKKEANSFCSSEQQIFEIVCDVCNTLGGKSEGRNSWWVGYFLPKIIANWDQDQYEFEMAWHLANPDRRADLINNIVDTLKKLIESTEDLVAQSGSNSY